MEQQLHKRLLGLWSLAADKNCLQLYRDVGALTPKVERYFYIMGPCKCIV